MKMSIEGGIFHAVAETPSEAWAIGLLSGQAKEERLDLASSADDAGVVRLEVPLGRKPGPKPGVRGRKREAEVPEAGEQSVGIVDEGLGLVT